MLSTAKCTCGGWPIPALKLVAVPLPSSCPVHGKALRKRGTDDWTDIMGTTPPNQTEITEKGGATHVQ